MGVVLAPVNGAGVAARLAAAGAGELYMGFHDRAWEARFGGRPLNRMSGFGGEANALSFEELLDEAGGIERAYCVFNALWYAPREEDYIARNYFPGLAEAGFTGVILSGSGLVQAAHDNGLTAVASTMCAVYSAPLARWHADAGFDRVIIPRDVSLAEIEQIAHEVPDMSLEVFLMRNGCPFADSHCMGLHRAGRPSMCRTLRESAAWRQVPDEGPRTLPRDDDRKPAIQTPLQQTRHGAASHTPRRRIDHDAATENRMVWAERFHLNTCGLCALWRLEQAGVDAYKVVGRGDDVDDLAADVELVARNIQIARSCIDEASYLARMERPEGLLPLCANDGLSCYYPEVRF